VHKVVEFHLQHATDIVELDRFFTDSSAFPLPATDPNYVVGQLKKYVFGLSFPGTQKQLNVFFQTLGERAVLGGEQDRLVSQLSTALSEDFEAGDHGKPTMRAYFLHAIFPSYIEIALEHPAGWVLGVPILRALSKVLEDLKLNIDSTHPGSLASVRSMLSTVLDSMRRAASTSMATADAFSVLHIIGVLTLLLQAFVPVIKLADWVGADEAARDCADFIIRFAAYARKMVTVRERREDEAQRPLDVRAMSDRPQNMFEGGRKHCKDTLKAYFVARWTRTGERWMVLDRTVETPRYPGEYEEGDDGVKGLFVRAVEEVMTVAARTEVLGEAVRDVDKEVWRMEGRGWPWRRDGGRGVRGLEAVFC
jgi:hypothetical protein